MSVAGPLVAAPQVLDTMPSHDAESDLQPPSGPRVGVAVEGLVTVFNGAPALPHW